MTPISLTHNGRVGTSEVPACSVCGALTTRATTREVGHLLPLYEGKPDVTKNSFRVCLNNKKHLSFLVVNMLGKTASWSVRRADWGGDRLKC